MKALYFVIESESREGQIPLIMGASDTKKDVWTLYCSMFNEEGSLIYRGYRAFVRLDGTGVHVESSAGAPECNCVLLIKRWLVSMTEGIEFNQPETTYLHAERWKPSEGGIIGYQRIIEGLRTIRNYIVLDKDDLDPVMAELDTLMELTRNMAATPQKAEP